ncbi:MAG: spondin domain-containing protein [Acidimicrobiales bacterium]
MNHAAVQPTTLAFLITVRASVTVIDQQQGAAKMTSMSFRRALGALLVSVLAVAGLGTTPAGAQTGGPPRVEVTVTITNLAPTDGTIQTPFWAAIHNGRFDTYNGNEPASSELERLAEDGNTGPISAAFAASRARGQDATIAGENGPLGPGESASYTFIVDPNVRSSRFFSYASMVIPSNDAFVSNGFARNHRLFNAEGEWVGENFVIPGSAVLDAGTEENDEIPANTAALAQAAPDTGVTEGGVVRAHAGFNDGGNVLDAVPNGDFTAAEYDIASIEFDVEEIPSTAAAGRLKGSNEVPAVTTNATGRAVARLTATGDLLVRFRANGTGGITAAHVHLGGPGQNGDVVVSLYSDPSGAASSLQVGRIITPADLVGSMAGMSISDLWDVFEDRGAYINVHSLTNPAGELRGNPRLR